MTRVRCALISPRRASSLNEYHDAAVKRYKKAKQVHHIMRHVAVKLQTPVEELYEQFGWDLYEKVGYDHAYDAFRVALS